MKNLSWPDHIILSDVLKGLKGKLVFLRDVWVG